MSLILLNFLEISFKRVYLLGVIMSAFAVIVGAQVFVKVELTIFFVVIAGSFVVIPGSGVITIIIVATMSFLVSVVFSLFIVF